MVAPTFDGMVALDGLVEPEAGQTLLAARHADALTELAGRTLEGASCPTPVGSGPS